VPIWQREHAVLDAEFAPDGTERLRADLRAFS